MATRSKHGGANVRVPPPLVFLACIAIAIAVHRFAWPVTLPLPPWPRVVAGSLIAMAGLGMLMVAGAWFRRTGQDPVPWKPSPELVVKGIYRYTRNPMYAGMTLMQVGIGIAVDNTLMAALAPISLLVVHFIAVRPEEAYLEEQFGESYARYRASVRRYL